MKSSNEGKLIIVSGPSGAGKSSVLSLLMDTCDLPLESSISATTRLPRPNEVDGVDYHFLTQEQFAEFQASGRFLETAEVFELGFWYGTLKEPVESALSDGRWVILEIDVTGAMTVLNDFPDAITIFLDPGSKEELEKRLRGRKTESDETIKRRLSFAQTEKEMAAGYKHFVVNEEIEKTAETICELLLKYKEPSCTKN